MTIQNVTDVSILQKSKIMQVTFADGHVFSYSFEFLRVFTPSAEARGHGDSPIHWPKDKQNIMITSAEPVGLYAVRLLFDDGHQSGLYSWDYLYDLGLHQQRYWQTYQQACQDGTP